MSKGSDIISKLIGAGSMVASMSFFAYIGSVHEFLLPGLLFGASGLWLVVRRGSPRPGTDLEAQQRFAQLSESLAATQAELAATQERLERLTEERDFMRQLGRPAVPQLTPDVTPRPVEMPLPPRPPEFVPPGL